jgi:hypothetical protein
VEHEDVDYDRSTIMIADIKGLEAEISKGLAKFEATHRDDLNQIIF